MLLHFKPLLLLLTGRVVWSQRKRFLVRLHGAGLHHNLQLAANLLVIHGANQRRAKQIPCLCALGIKLRGFLQRLGRFLHLPRVVQANPPIPVRPPHVPPTAVPPPPSILPPFPNPPP